MTEAKFGRYPQDPKAYVNGKRISIVDGKPQFNPLEQQPIEWLVLVEEEDKMLLLSKYALEYLPFNDWTADVTWESCTIRGWLNDTFNYQNANSDEVSFLDNCFSEEERNQIIPHVETGDKVFLLSLGEVLQYLPSNFFRKCLPTTYAVSRLPETHKYNEGDICTWWLRTESAEKKGFIMTINQKGMYCEHGVMVSMKGIGVRPALLIKK